MTLFRKPREFRSIIRENEALQAQLDKKAGEKGALEWRPVAFQTARMKYKFKMFSRRLGAIARYTIAKDAPNILWTEISSIPDNVSFEEAKDKEFSYVKMCKFGIMERGAMIKIPRRG